MKKHAPRCLKVSSPRNSECSIPLSRLNFGRWFAEGSSYLHVHHKTEDTIHRVYCKHSDTPRLAMRDGELYWLVDERSST